MNVKAESELQKLLIESPSLINIGEIREGTSPLVFALSEFGLPRSGYSDVIAFSLDGDIVVIECKLATNPEIKRKVIGQILEYAAYLWKMSYEEVDNRVKNLKGQSLAELVNGSVAGEWDEENFRNGIIQSLESGSFILIIVVDEICEELRRIIRYINECSESAFSLHALEMSRFHAGKTEVLVPHLYGISTKPPPREQRRQWTEKEFFSVLERNEPDILDVVKDIYDWSKGEADRVWFGTGKETGSITSHYLRDGETISIFSIYTNGRFTLNYGWLSPRISQQTMEEFHRRLHEIPAFSGITDDFSKWPSVRIDTIKKEGVEKLKQTILWFKGQVILN